MTTIVALQHNDVIYVGSDSGSTYGNIIETRKEAKIFFNHGFLFGVAGRASLSDFIEFTAPPPAGLNGESNLRAHLYSSWIPVLRKALIDANMAEMNSGVVSINGAILIAYGNQLCRIDNGLSVFTPEEGLMAIGSGGDFAMGSLASTQKMKPEKRIRLALEVAAKYDLYSQGPFAYLNTQNGGA